MKTRSILRRMLSAAALLTFAGTASAQAPSTWNGGGGNGLWSNAANWDDLPISNNDTDLIFGGALNLTTTNDLASPFLLTNLRLNAGTSNTEINGGGLQFITGTTSPKGISYATAAGRLLINSSVNFSVPSTIAIGVGANNAAGAEVWLAGPITNAVGNTVSLTTVPAATLTMITGRNNTNFNGTMSLNASTLIQLGNYNAMWRGTAVEFTGTCAITTGTTDAAGYGVLDAGYNQQIGSANGTGQFLVGTTNSPSTALVGFLGGTQILDGPAGLAGFNSNSHFGKVGTGTLTIQGENASFNMGLSVREGNMLLNGGLGALVNSLPTASAISIYGGSGATGSAVGQLRLNNTTIPATTGTPMNAQGRISDTVGIRLAGGILRLDSTVGATASPLGSLEQAGQIRVLAGQSTIVVNTNAAQPGRFNFIGVNEAGVDFSRGGQVAFAGPSLGSAPGNGIANITFTTNPTSVNGIIPWGLSQVTYTGSTSAGTNTFAFNALAELGPNGVRPLTTFVDNDLSSATQNVRLTNGTNTAGSANSLTIATGGSASSSVTVTSGAVMNTATTANVGALTTAGRLYVNGAPSTTLTVGPISAASLSKGGAGTVNVGALNLTGTSPIISVNAGTLNFGGPVGVGSGAPIYQVARAGTISGLSSVTGTLRGNGIIANSITMNTGSLLGGSTLSSDVGGPAGTTGAAPGTLTVNGTLGFTGGANTRLRFYLNSVFGGSNTQGLIVANTLDLTGVTPGAQLTVQPHSIDLKNNDTAPVYDFDPSQTYTWTLIQTSNPIVGFNASAFNIDLANFSNSGVSPADFTVAVQGNNLVLNFATAIPEPGLLGVVGLGLLGLARLRRKA